MYIYTYMDREIIYLQTEACIATSGIHGSKATGTVALRILITDS